MLILSQDKETILNFNNAVTLYVIRDSFSEEKGLENYNIDYSTNDEINYVLGTYATRERAKEVLQEIIRAYAQEDFYHIRKSQVNEICSLEEPKFIIQKVSRLKIYEMPEK